MKSPQERLKSSVKYKPHWLKEICIHLFYLQNSIQNQIQQKYLWFNSIGPLPPLWLNQHICTKSKFSCHLSNYWHGTLHIHWLTVSLSNYEYANYTIILMLVVGRCRPVFTNIYVFRGIYSFFRDISPQLLFHVPQLNFHPSCEQFARRRAGGSNQVLKYFMVKLKCFCLELAHINYDFQINYTND